ncbi:hypothetical protein D3C81_1620020 [compost metagenome]
MSVSLITPLVSTAVVGAVATGGMFSRSAMKRRLSARLPPMGRKFRRISAWSWVSPIISRTSALFAVGDCRSITHALTLATPGMLSMISGATKVTTPPPAPLLVSTWLTESWPAAS